MSKKKTCKSDHKHNILCEVEHSATVQVLKFCIDSIAFDTVTHARLGEYINKKCHKVMIEA